jgi:2,3-dihydroxybenzoate-AMP ligase
MLDGFVPWPPEFADRYRSADHCNGSAIGQLQAENADRHPDKILASRRVGCEHVRDRGLRAANCRTS